MLTTQQRLFRRFWYAIMPVHELEGGPKPFRLMGEDIVLFLDGQGEPRALRDRCCHRTAKLSKGWCQGGNLVCGYHGWEYDGTGKLVRIPQYDESTPLPDLGVDSYWCMARYGYVWVALEEPIEDLFDIPEDRDPGFRRIFQFYETWKTAPLRMMENSFDNAHFSFVHKNTFGDATQPKPKRYEIVETDYGFYAASSVEILNPPEAHEVTGDTNPTTVRKMENHWYLPFCRRMDMEYPSGIRHIIINCATPIDDGTIQLVQLLYRNDTEADCSTAKLIEWDLKITIEDKEILESTDYDATIDIGRKIESHMVSDRPGMIMRNRLLDLLRQNGEDEIRRPEPPAPPPTRPGEMLRGPGAPGTMPVVVDRVVREAERVVALDLVAPDGGELPPFAPGAHIDVHVATGIVRQYSLCGDPEDRRRYRIAVLLEAASRGGSATIHDAFKEGRRVRITAPRSNFALEMAAPFTLLVAGGIGVTPVIPMALALHRAGGEFALHYSAHGRATAPFLETLESGPLAANLHVHLASGENPHRFDALATLAAAPPGTHVYVCGPSRLQDAVADAAARLGWDPARVHRERFTADVDRKGEPFTVVAARSGVTAEVPSERSIAQVLAERGVEIPISCEQGVCGTCVTRVVSGEVDHRDLFLNEAEKVTNSRITVCCSRGRAGQTLVLDA
ncbi:Rieske 2Fe-2S domain-containing protein [Roseomonas sp. NAR14]|uniref:Rieske 2Fe-2S domain-containing protein n=1 Tax=Roseomonas acroporae TaxID=2937791 RepID=A0A9X1Y8Y7_9PROT|nr:Rieske 2Fe-2S domain-containing protein [Roseomonas acroporae]MCK8785303.1 Rieske 2Fe-2S domain-containing protein [Roseomonas acroporae]